MIYYVILSKMALFVHNKNQELLWSVINKTPIFQQVFSNSTRNEPELWFRAHIQNFYQKIQYTNISSQDLPEYNREIISTMMNNLNEFSKEQYVPSQPAMNNIPNLQSQQMNNIPNQPSPINQYNNMQQLPYTVENKQDAYSRQFDERKREYDMMTSKPELPKVDFAGNVKDTAIANMDELIKQHMQQRDAELQKYAPPPLENVVHAGSQIKIEKNENISLVPDVIMEPEFENSDTKTAKKVSWAENLEEYNNTKINDCLNEIADLKHQVLNMTNIFINFKEEIKELILRGTGSPGTLPSDGIINQTTKNNLGLVDGLNNNEIQGTINE